VTVMKKSCGFSVFMKLWNPWHFLNFLFPPPQPYQ